MHSKIHWKKRPFTNSYSIYSNNHLVGKLNERTFSQTANGEIEDLKYLFKTSGFIKQHTKIIDRSQNKIIGEISFGPWMTKATLSVNSKNYYWRYDNFFNTKWRIFNAEGAEIKYTGSSTGGQIDSNTDDPILLLSGLFVKNYYLGMTIVALIAVFIPIWITVIV
jgi:hypothetical protein